MDEYDDDKNETENQNQLKGSMQSTIQNKNFESPDHKNITGAYTGGIQEAGTDNQQLLSTASFKINPQSSIRKMQEKEFNQSKGPKGFSVSSSPQKSITNPGQVNADNQNFTIMQIEDQDGSNEKKKNNDEANMTLGNEGSFQVPDLVDKQIDVSLDPKKHLLSVQ